MTAPASKSLAASAQRPRPRPFRVADHAAPLLLQAADGFQIELARSGVPSEGDDSEGTATGAPSLRDGESLWNPIGPGIIGRDDATNDEQTIWLRVPEHDTPGGSECVRRHQWREVGDGEPAAERRRGPVLSMRLFLRQTSYTPWITWCSVTCRHLGMGDRPVPCSTMHLPPHASLRGASNKPYRDYVYTSVYIEWPRSTSESPSRLSCMVSHASAHSPPLSRMMASRRAE